LNASRWFAAFLVVIGHVFYISIPYHRDVVHPNLFWRGVNFACGFGYMAVIVFFVISGFPVGGQAILNLRDKGFNIIDYFVNRFSRIYTVLVPALIVGFMLDWLGIKLFNASGIYTHPDAFYTNPFGTDITDHLSFKIFVGNLLQLQTITVTSLGSNGPLWSLANEWWYYVLFGFCMIAYRPGRLFTRAIAGGVIVTMITVLPLTISLWFIVWGIGVGVAVLDRYWAGWPFFVGATIMVVCLVALRWITARQTEMGTAALFAEDVAVALSYSIALLCAKNLKGRRRFESLHRTLASFSYTLYLLHFPAMVFMAAFMNAVFGIGYLRQPNLTTIVYGGALLTMVYGYAWIFAGFTEAHTNAVRSRLSRAIPALLYWTKSLGPQKRLQAD
jgi:peptidoglycan/LPS O-acetylase OafA/YrhL